MLVYQRVTNEVTPKLHESCRIASSVVILFRRLRKKPQGQSWAIRGNLRQPLQALKNWPKIEDANDFADKRWFGPSKMVRWCEIHGCFCCKHGNESRITCQWVLGEDIDLPGYISGGWWFLRVVISGGLFATKGCNDLQRLPVATIHLSLSLISCSFRALEETLRASSISAETATPLASFRCHLGSSSQMDC